MRIIDKNSDFYDYIQNIYWDNSLVFDRTNSFLLTREKMCDNLSVIGRKNSDYILLQVCNTFWLFFIKITKRNHYDYPLNYTIELLATWKNYDKKKELIKFNIISFSFFGEYQHDKKTIESFIQRVNSDDYIIKKNIAKSIIYQDFRGSFKTIEKNIPLLKACGIANLINPMDIYLSFEEYFSLEKMEKEASIEITDINKLEKHGFDKKTSFRTYKKGGIING